MTTRLYYDDSSLLTFDATVVSCTPSGAGYAVTLDRSAFYPTSGGQPFDTGTLDDIPVLEVSDGEDHVVHVVAAPLEVGRRVTGVVDAARRSDHREQHTGQHVLSAAFERVCGVATVGFHIGAESSTIDLAREVSAAEIDAAETSANRVVRNNVPVVVRIVPEDAVASLSLRRAPTRTGPLRIVEIDGVDVSACGGTHVTATGAIGLIVVTGTEKVRGGSRLTFLCGERALRGFRQRQARLVDLARMFGTAPLDVVPPIERLRDEARASQRALRELQNELAAYRADEWRAGAETIGPLRVVSRATTLGAGELKSQAQALVEAPGLVAVLTGAGEPRPVVVARSSDVAFDAGAFLNALTAALGGRGGGRSELAQGAVPAAAPAVDEWVRREIAGASVTGGEHTGQSSATRADMS